MTDEQAIRDLIDRWQAASAVGEYASLDPLMHPDVIFLTAGNEPFGRDQFRLGFESITRTMRLESSTDLRELTVAGDFAFAHSFIRVRMVPKAGGGDPIERQGHVLSVYKRTEDRWQLFRDANLMVRG